MVTDAPKPTGKPPTTIELTGTLFPWDGVQPVLLSMPGSAYLYLPCFTTEEKLRALMAQAGVPFRSIKQIQNGSEFLQGILESPGASELKIILDPYFLPNGRVRFVEVLTN